MATLQREARVSAVTQPSEAVAAPAADLRLVPLAGTVDGELAATAASYLEPTAFFVSWQGVLTLAFSGFTAPLLDLKRRLSAAHPCLPPENPGSRWPKMSLGCLRDGLRLTPDQLALLCRLCSEESAHFRLQADHSDAAAAAAPGRVAVASPLRLAVDCAAVTLYETRSLERLVSCQLVGFQGGLDEAPPSSEERARVAAILAEPSSPTYWFAASRDGNREAHYRGSHLGATLMHPLLLGGSASGGAAAGAAAAAAEARPALKGGHAELHDDARVKADVAARRALLAAVDRFRRRVEQELPDLYVFFSDASLHITLRALIN